MSRVKTIVVAGFAWTVAASVAWGQYRPPPPAPRLPPLVSSNSRNIYAPWSGPAAGSPYANHSSALRAAPLPQDTLAAGYAVPLRAPYSVPYGPHFSRPPGSPVVPFGSSRYYYRGWIAP